MLSSTLLTPLSLLLTLTTPIAARALFSAEHYILSNLVAHSPSGRPDNPVNNITFTFNIWDPEPVANVSTSCTGSWAASSNITSTQRAPCQNPSFGWSLSNFKGIEDFLLEVQHSYIDPNLGPPPLNRGTTFAHNNFNAANLTCVGSASGQMECGLKEKTAFLPIYQAIG